MKSSRSKRRARALGAALAGVLAGSSMSLGCGQGVEAAGPGTEANGCNGPNGCGGEGAEMAGAAAPAEDANGCNGPNGCGGEAEAGAPAAP